MIRPGRRQALAGFLAGAAALFSGSAKPTTARKKHKHKHKHKHTSCPEPTICPPRDTCPARTCCRCTAGGVNVSCTLLPAGASTTDCTARCDPNDGVLFTPRPGVETMVCSGADCVFASCPI